MLPIESRRRTGEGTSETSTTAAAMLWFGRAIRQGVKAQSSLESGGLFIGMVICFPVSKSVAVVLLVLNLGTYATHIAANEVEKRLPSAAQESFQSLRGRCKVLKDKLSLVIIVLIAAVVGIISLAAGLSVALLAAALRGAAASAEDTPQPAKNNDELDV